MNALALRYLDYRPIEIETLIGRGARQLTMDLVAIDRVKEYAAEDADVTLRLKRVLWPRVVETGMEALYVAIEEPMIRVLADIETAGASTARRWRPMPWSWAAAWRSWRPKSGFWPTNRRSTSIRRASWASCSLRRCASTRSPR